MKKILGLFSLLVYIVSTNALIHAQSMRILPDHQMMGMSSCHGHHSNSSTKQSVDCCELVYSNQYSHTQIQPKDILQIISFVHHSTYLANTIVFQGDTYNLFLSNFSPWRDPDIKYQKFSDLMWIVVDLA